MVHDPLCDLGPPKSTQKSKILPKRPFFDPLEVKNEKINSNKSCLYQLTTSSEKKFLKKVQGESCERFFPKMDPDFDEPFTPPYGLNIKKLFPTKVSLTHELSIPKKKIPKKCKGKAVKDFSQPLYRRVPP